MFGIPFLSKPLDIYKQSYVTALKEFQLEGLHLAYDLSEISKDFQHFLAQLGDLERNPKVNMGKVKESTYWLIDHNEFVGRVSIRHTLNTYLEKYDGNIGFEIRPSKRRIGYGKLILQLGLYEARQIGLNQVLIMCDERNIGSIKVIEANYGLLVDRYILKIEGKDTYVRKYCITYAN